MIKKFTFPVLFFLIVQLTLTVNLVFAQFPYGDSFRGAGAPGMSFGGSAFLTANQAQVAANGALGSGGTNQMTTADPENGGYLRLTRSVASQAGYAYNSRLFPSRDGMSISFEYYTYGGNGADGLVFYLFDAEVLNRSAAASQAVGYSDGGFNIGSYGGSLGYSQRSDPNAGGLSKAFLGVALDEFGNFGTSPQGRVGGYSAGGAARTANWVTLRGDGDGTGTVQTGTGIPNSNYEYLIGVNTANSTAYTSGGATTTVAMGGSFNIAGGVQLGSSTTPNRQSGLAENNNGYRKADIRIEYLSPTLFRINVYVTKNSGSGAVTHHVIQDYMYSPTAPAPENLCYGFSASTGGSTNVHEVRSINIRVPSGVAKSPAITNVTKAGNQNTAITFSPSNFYNATYSLSKFQDPNGDPINKIRINDLPSNGELKLAGSNILAGQEIDFGAIASLTYVPQAAFSGTDTFKWSASDPGGLYSQVADVILTVNPVEVSDLPPPVSEAPNLYKIRIRLSNPTAASYRHAENPYNKSLVSIFQVDDSPKTIYNLMYPYLHGGTTAGGYSSPGVRSTDGAGNDLYWNISAACFVQDNNGNDLLSGNPNFISWSELAIVTANGPGLQRGFDFTNHGFGGSDLLQRDRYKQIYSNNKAAFDRLGFQPEALVVPDVQIGYRFGANDMGMDVTSQAGPDPLKDGVTPFAENAYSQDIYAAIQNPVFIRRNHWQETNNAALAAEHKGYLQTAYNKSLVKPAIYNWFSHGPGEMNTSNFAYYREVIDYLKSIAGDNVIGLSLEQYLGYQKTRYAAEHGSGTSSVLNGSYLDITFDMATLKSTVRNRLLSLLVDSDGDIQNITWSSNIKAVTFNPQTGLVNVQLNEGEGVDPAALPKRPTIVANTVRIPSDAPNKVIFTLDRAVSQSTAAAYSVPGNTVTSLSEVSGSSGLSWQITFANNFLSTDVVSLTYKAELGNATDAANGTRMLTYNGLPIINQSQVTLPEEPPLAISIRRDSDNRQLATFNTIAEVRTYMNSFNFNTNISIVFNNVATYNLASKWTLNYNNTAYTLTIKGKDGLETFPLIDAGGLTSDPFRVAMSHVRIQKLKIRSGKYTSDGAQFGDNYSGAVISQEANTSDVQYTDLELYHGMRGIRIGASNGTASPNISDILIDRVVLRDLTGISIQVGIQSTVGGEPESRTDASYTLNNVTISRITLKDAGNQQNIENSGAKYYGQIMARGINGLVIRDVVADQTQKQPVYVASCKNVLIDRIKATNFSINTGTGYRAAIQVESTDMVTIQNSYVQAPIESAYIADSRRIKLYHNTFDIQQSLFHAINIQNARVIEDIQGNLFAVKGDGAGRSAVSISFYRGNGYIPVFANDFISEQNNLYVTNSLVYEFQGIGSGNTNLTVSNSGTPFSTYKTTYNRGQNSQTSLPSAVFFADYEGTSGYLDNGSAGRRFIAQPVAGLTTDLANNTRTYPADAGAYHRPGVISANLSAIAVSAGKLSPVFQPSVTDYALPVSHATASVTLTPEAADLGATMRSRVNGGAFNVIAPGSASSPLALNVGANAVELEVTASDGLTQSIYALNVIRASESFVLSVPDAAVPENSVFTGSAPVVTGIPHGDLKYTLTGPDRYDFNIDVSTGVLSMVARNYESPADADLDNIYETTIVATDLSGTAAQKNVRITVTDITESAIFTLSAISDTVINENTLFAGAAPVVSGSTIGGTAPAGFSIIPVPDTQFYTAQSNGGTNTIFKSQMNWITGSKSALNTRYVVHLGDVVDKGDEAIQWMRADTALKLIENPATTQLSHGIPYALNVGNHDQTPFGSASGSTALYNTYFGSSRFAGRSYYGGHYGSDNDNNYQVFAAGGMEFIALNLEFDPQANPQVLTWADDLLKANPGKRAIVSSHYILNPNGTFGAQGQAIYDKLKTNPNLFLMLSGHMNPNGEASRTDTFNGNTVTTILSDYQDRPNGGNGWMRYMDFQPSQNKIFVNTYSPYLDQYETDADSRFSVDYKMTGDVLPNSVRYTLGGADAAHFTVDSLSGIVKLTARNFESPVDSNEDNIYEVTLIAADADGNTASESFTVTVADVIEPADFHIGEIANVSIAEDTPYTSGTPGITGAPIGKLTFTLTGADALKFSVDPVSGVVSMTGRSFAQPADANADNIYEVTIVATDEDENTASASFTVKVTRFTPYPYAETFKEPAVNRMVFGGNPQPAVLTSGTVDPSGAGYLRLTTNTNNQTAFARNTTPLPTEEGMSVSFDYYTYGGTGADGLVFFLYDAAAAPFNIGGFGGSLGYSQNQSLPGVSKGFLGIGFDEFGNFSNPTANRPGGPGQRASSVTLRGDGNGNSPAANNYEYLTGIQTTDAAAMNAAGAGGVFPIAGGVNGRISGDLTSSMQGYRRAKIDLVPNAAGNGFKINVWVTEGSTAGGRIHHLIKDYSYIPTSGIPPVLNYGFSAGTGGQNNYHEVRNLEIKLPEAIVVPPTLANLDKTVPENTVLQFTSDDFTSKFVPGSGAELVRVKVTTLPSKGGLTLDGVALSAGAEIPAGQLPLLSYVPNLNQHGSDMFTWNGSDGVSYAASAANVSIAITPAPVFPHSETFRLSHAQGLEYGGLPIPAALTSGNIDPQDAGYLRLTSNAVNQKGFARSTKSFPTADGLSISFEYFTYGGSGADGISFFLYDPAANPFVIGGFGGSLGYAQNNGAPGVSRAYLGIGLDEFGNFSQAGAGRQGGPGQRPSSVTLRGDGNGNTLIPSNYEYLTSIQTTNAAVMSAASAGNTFQVAGGINGRTAGSDGLTATHTGYRKARIDLTKNALGNGFIVNIWITEGSASGGIVHHLVNNYSYIGDTFPANLSYGFAGSTGGSTNYHEIRNLTIDRILPQQTQQQAAAFKTNSLMSLKDMAFGRNASAIREGGEAVSGPSGTELSATNLITPNGDGKNDTWIVRNIHLYPKNTLRIYNKLGIEVFSAKNYINDWDGKSYGADLPEDVYYFILDFGNAHPQMRGYVNIVR